MDTSQKVTTAEFFNDRSIRKSDFVVLVKYLEKSQIHAAALYLNTDQLDPE